MEENFSRIEDYLNNNLDQAEKERFEQELKTNNELDERFNFYKNFQNRQVLEFKPIIHEKKILPEINNINFTQNNNTFKGINKTAIGILIIFISLSSYLFLTNNLNKSKITAIQAKNDSIFKANQDINYQLSQIIQNNKNVNFTDSAKGNDLILKRLIQKKEQEIASLKEAGSKGESATLQKEIDGLKKELAKAKQDYYEKVGQFANDKVQTGNKNAEFVNNISLWLIDDSLEISWKSNDKFKTRIVNQKDEKLYFSNTYLKDKWRIKTPKDGFYFLELYPLKGGNIEILMEIDASPKIWLRR